MISRSYFFTAEVYKNDKLCTKCSQTMTMKTWKSMSPSDLMIEAEKSIEQFVCDEDKTVIVVGLNRL